MLTRLRSLAARSHPRRQPPERLAAAAVSLLAGVAVYAVAVGVFPYHSLNHDEGVYLQQAALLLDGQLAMRAGELADAVRPWFFVQDGGRLYPKYQPYPAVLFAVPMAVFGEPRLALAAVAAANAALVYVLGAVAFDRRVGVVASAAFAAAPMTLLTSSVFLPYAPTTTLNLAFAACYLRSLRTGSARTAALAGGAIGLAFFARPYTAVLFAAPFVAHAVWRVIAALRREGLSAIARDRALPAPVRRNVATGVVGLAFVAFALAYNAVLNGSPWLFAYQAFAPLDGPGFGHRELLGAGIEYTPAVALDANALVVRFLLTRWGPGGLIGSGLALAGLAIAAREWRASSAGGRVEGTAARRDESDGQSDESNDETGDRERAGVCHTAQVLLAGLFVTIPLGNVAFWGNYNVLGGSPDPTTGLLASFGPYYHFDLLAPLSIFAAAAAVATWRWGRAARASDGNAGAEAETLAADRIAARLPDAVDRRRVGSAAIALVVVAGLLAGAANAALLTGPMERNAAHTQGLEQAYEPFEDADLVGAGHGDADLENAVVFLPPTYGPWLNHPFQALRNEPGLDGPAVYAMDRDPASDLAVVDAYPGRTYYRYSYRGEWPPGPDEPVVPTLERLDLRAGDRLEGATTVGVPAEAEHAAVRLETDAGEHADYVLEAPNETETVEWSLAADGARLQRPNGTLADEPLAVDDADELALQVRLVQQGASLTYRHESTVRTTVDGRVEVLWPPERTVCPIVDDCGSEGTYLPDRPDAHRDGVAFETDLRAP